MQLLPRRRRIGFARLSAVSLAAAVTLSLVLPAVASASSGHGGGGGITLLALPIGSIFSDILGTVSGFGKDIIKTLFSSILTLFFGGSWKVLLHPYEIIEWLIGLPGTGNTTAFVPFGNTSAGGFAALVRDTQAIGLGLLPLALANSTLHLVSGGVFTRPRDHAHDFAKVFMAACAILAWPWLFGQAIDIANAVTLALLHAANANDNLWKTLGAYFVTAWAGGFLDLITTFFLIATALLLVGLIVMKIVLMIMLAFLLVAGPIAIAFYPFEFLARVLTLFGGVFLALALIPLGWAVLFALFTAFGASVFGFSNFLHAGLLGGGVKSIFDLICSLICFYLAWKWPFIIIGRITSLVGGDIAAAGEAFSAFGHRKLGGAGSAGGAGGGAQSAGAGGADEASGGGLTGKLRGLGSLAEGLGASGGGALSGLGGSAAVYAGYGLGGQGLRAASSALHRFGGSGGAGAGANPVAGAGAGERPTSPVGAALADGPDAGFDAVRTSGKDFSAAVAQVPNGADDAPAGPAQKLAQHAAATAGLTSNTQHPLATPAAAPTALPSDGVTPPGGSPASDVTPAPSTGAPGSEPLRAAQAAVNGAAPVQNGAASPAATGSGADAPASSADPRQLLHAPAAPAPTTGPSTPGASNTSSGSAPARPGQLAGERPASNPKPVAAQPPSKSGAPAPAPASAPRPSAPPAPASTQPSRSGSPNGPPPRSRTSERSRPPAPSAPPSGSERAADPPPASPERPPQPVSPPENH